MKLELQENGTTRFSNDAKENPNPKPENRIYGNQIIRHENGEIELKHVELQSVTLTTSAYNK